MLQVQRRIQGTFSLLMVVISFISSSAYGNSPPSFTSDTFAPVVPENSPVGTLVLTLVGEDPEGSRVRYGVQGTDRFSVDPDTGELRVAKPLDREINDTLTFNVTLEDEVEGEGVSNNLVEVPISVILVDENDNPPVFIHTPYEVVVPEDTPVDQVILDSIKVEDPDLLGESIEVTCREHAESGDACSKFVLVPDVQSTNLYTASLKLHSSLDFAQTQFYRLVLEATDGEHVSKTNVDIRIGDVQNSPPVFSNESFAGEVPENVPIGSVVLRVEAKDGDFAQPRSIYYDLLSNPGDFFLIDSTTGELKTAKPLDREVLNETNGVISLTVRAREISDGKPLQEDQATAFATATVTIRDVNDSPPQFNKKEYVVSIAEDIEVGTLLPDMDMIVTDPDLGMNSAFSVRLEDVSKCFSVEPDSGLGTAKLSIRVMSGCKLDYEDPTQRKYIILVIAEETQTVEKLSSTATLIVQIMDSNDNAPSFELSAYSATVSETAQAGTPITTITAQDPDGGDLGTAGIQYELIGEHADRFLVNPKLGMVSVGFCSTPGIAPCLDFETQPVYNMTFKATDNMGKGNSQSVPLTINLQDANDNPPEFSQEAFSASIEEGVIAFEPRLIIQATDPDKTSVIEYSMEDTLEQLTIDRSTGEISVTSPNGLEIVTPGENFISLVVQASDGMFVAKVPVTIQVIDVNNNQPVFEKETYDVNIAEDVQMGPQEERSLQVKMVVTKPSLELSMLGVSLLRVSAHDNDEGINAELSYRIEKGANNDFNIHNTTGVIYATSKLDYDKRDKYSLHVIAVDGGTPSLTGSTTVNIAITNVNDKEPYFTPTTQRAEVLENVPVGTVVHKLAARDLDVADPSALRYSWGPVSSAVDMSGNEVLADSYKDLFSIDSSTGWVSVARTLSRDIAVSVKLGVVVTDQSAPVLQQGMGTLIISIIDVNDIPPEFEPPWTRDEPNYLLEVEEEQPIGTPLGKFTAIDKDSSISHYMLEQDGDMFSVNNKTGEVFIESRLDYETIQSVNFTLVAYDSGIPQLSTVANVYVQLININDNAPVFSQSSYNATVKENALGDTRILLVTAEDADLGDLGRITYKLEGSGSQQFRINASTGQITVAPDAILDRELTEEIHFNVVARDLAPLPLSVSVPVNIKILDVNDNRPEFKSKQYRTSIQENIIITPSPTLLTLEAVDKDDNPHLSYRIVSGNEEDVFAVDDTSGVLTIQGPLAKGKTEYNLLVQVSDGMLSDTARVDISIEPVNLERPVFVTPPPNDSKAYIRENSPIGSLVVKVKAEDGDAGENGRISYHLSQNGTQVQHTAQFSIDPDSGAITTRAMLDREEKSSYQVYLVARDHGSPMHLETIQPLLVYVEDEDDNQPVFQTSNRTIIFFTKENLPLHTRIGKLQAIDLDEGNNSRIFYFIISGNENNSFKLDKRDGSIYNEVHLDREANSLYEMFIKASSEENYAENEPSYTDDDNSVVLVRILVQDENDNPPRFDQDNYYKGVSSHTGPGHLVTQVSASDPDEGDYAHFSFLIQASHLYKSGSNMSSGSVVPAPFSIDETSGRISTAQRMAEYNQDRFKLEVVARETSPPYRESTALVHVWIYEPQQLIRIILSRPPGEIYSEIPELTRDLTNVTGSLIVVDDITAHVTRQGDVRVGWTDMYVHAVDSRSGEIATIPHILRVIDEKYDTLKSYYVGVAIENVLPAHPSVQDDKFEPGLAALVALVIVLLVGLLAVCVLCCCCKQWISADSNSTGTPHKSEMLIKKQKQFIDDLSITENPLWIEQKLKLYEEQELTMQVFCDLDRGGSTDSRGVVRRGSLDNLSNGAGADNTYATIQGGAGDYATLGGSIIPLDNVSSHSQQMYEASLGFQGSTFQVPKSNEILRKPPPLPSPPTEVDKDSHQPEFVLELI